MKRISSRTVFMTILSVIVIVGIAAFVVQYFVKADTWVTFPGSPHVYSGGNISTGSVRDRDGLLVLTNGERREYADDAMTRMATMHLLGDRYGYIEAPLINTYADKLLDYNSITGVYTTSETGNVLNLTLSAKACVTALEGLGNRKGTVGVYNYKTGEILCMVSSGTYDPDDMPDMETIESYDYYEGVFLNRFTRSVYVPGSIFKLITAAAAIDNIPDVFDRSFYCEQETIIGGEYITCEQYHGGISFGTGLVKSCNIVFGELAVELGPEILTRYAEAAGVNSAVSFDGTTVAEGNFDLSGAGDNDVAWAGIGDLCGLHCRRRTGRLSLCGGQCGNAKRRKGLRGPADHAGPDHVRVHRSRVDGDDAQRRGAELRHLLLSGCVCLRQIRHRRGGGRGAQRHVRRFCAG